MRMKEKVQKEAARTAMVCGSETVSGEEETGEGASGSRDENVETPSGVSRMDRIWDGNIKRDTAGPFFWKADKMLTALTNKCHTRGRWRKHCDKNHQKMFW